MCGWLYKLATLSIVGIFARTCGGPDHLAQSRYEYRYINGTLVSPYDSLPDGLERGEWQCYDAKLRRAFDCAFVHGGWEQYQGIYRRKR
jgi:hypothetical protein